MADREEAPGASAASAPADRRCLDRQPASLRPRRCGARGDRSRRRLEVPRSRDGAQLPASGHGPRRAPAHEGGVCHTSASSPRLLRAMVDQYSARVASSRRHLDSTSTNSPFRFNRRRSKARALLFIASAPTSPRRWTPRLTMIKPPGSTNSGQRGNEGDTSLPHIAGEWARLGKRVPLSPTRKSSALDSSDSLPRLFRVIGLSTGCAPPARCGSRARRRSCRK